MDRKEYFRKWKREHKEHIREEHRKWRKRNPVKRKEYNRRYYLKHKELMRKNSRNYSKRVWRNLIEFLGAKCCQCGFDDIRALQIDHKKGGGFREVKMFGSNNTMYRYYRNHPEEAKSKLQVLCANCNLIKKREKKEVRKEEETNGSGILY